MESRFPAPFLAAMRSRLGTDMEPWLQAMDSPPPVSIRINPRKVSEHPLPESVPWADQGKYLDQRPVFALDPAWHAGAYYVQEASSMLIEAAIPQHYQDQPIRALDLCAAPGGKSTHLASLLHPHSLIVSNEVIKQRARILEENLTRWGNGNHIITNLDPAMVARLSNFFNLILVDAPCSGEGMFRKDPAAIEEWSPEHVSLCSSRQTRILHDIWPALKPGGMLLYSTCTWNDLEDEGVVNQFIQETGAEVIPIPIHPEWGFTNISLRQGSGLMSLPHRVQGEGFFIVALQKPGNWSEVELPSKKFRKLTLASRKQRELAGSFLSDQWGLFDHQGGIHAFPTVQFPAAEHLLTQVPIISMGVELGEIKGKDFRPGPDSAFWTGLPLQRHHSVELSLEQALAFLRRDPLTGIRERGWLLMTFRGIPLGWAKGLGNRLNNYYPQQWRLRMDIPAGSLSPSLISNKKS